MTTQALREKRNFYALTAALILADGNAAAALQWAQRAAELDAEIERAEA
ncbi:MAG: hypothetical protein V4531_08510 [Actinomycetota bacterium]